MKITKNIIIQLVNHAKKEVPIEACGYLGAKDGVITAIYALTNVDKSSEHFSFAPKEQFAALRDAREKDLEICAVYHSHPVSPARPSEEDIAKAYDPEILYVIVSLAQGKEDIRAFRIKNKTVGQVDLEIIDNVRI
ncbi:MAG: M67 family metallopeptidase [Candidatus Omnitrophota bacterium]